MFKRIGKFSLGLVLLLTTFTLPSAAQQSLFEPIDLFSWLTDDAKDESNDSFSPVACVAAPANLVSWYRAENNANDSTGVNNGTLQNGATFGAGQVGQAFNLDGNDDSVEIPHNPNLNITGSFSAEAWIFPRSIPSQNTRILDKDPWNMVLKTSPANALNVNINNGGAITSANAIPLNQWTHVAFTLNGTTGEIQIFINGILSASGTTPNPITGGTEPLTIGNNPGPTGFDGLIDEPSIYNRALSQTEIQSIFNAGNAGKCITCIASPVNQVSWYRAENNANDSQGT
ncbi:MAG: LamG domain-containing protein, partial [Pyrinomonadaceae bacterium]|nr:LamG domain-containing protein [Pyrinomonadaceae bacterium]